MRTCSADIARHHVPERTCVACGERKPKWEMARLVRTAGGQIEVDERGKRAGRGAYLCRAADCWAKALGKGRKNRLAHALKTELTLGQSGDLLELGRALLKTPE